VSKAQQKIVQSPIQWTTSKVQSPKSVHHNLHVEGATGPVAVIVTPVRGNELLNNITQMITQRGMNDEQGNQVGLVIAPEASQ
jgi:hypothetical protein